MSNRDLLAHNFVVRSGWSDADIRPLAGDASNRRYLRLIRSGGETAVLMDASPEKGEDIRPFTYISNILSTADLSAPVILAQDSETGFMLLEDLGDDLFARVLLKTPALEDTLYAAATDLLETLHQMPTPVDLAIYDAPLMAELAALVFDWYLPALSDSNPHQKQVFLAEMQQALQSHAAEADCLIQRDYHAENLLWLPEREGVARVGLLDYQDAMRGHRAYDLVSLLQDARRDVSPQIETDMLRQYIDQTGQDQHRFEAAYHVLGAQRNLRILGVFARLCIRDGKAHYIDLIPRVWAHLQRDLKHPALSNIADILHLLPHPDPDALLRLKSQCAHQTP